MNQQPGSTATQHTAAEEAACRVLAMVLPQFHPIAQNDEWWGKGFTEWTNVVKARPKFAGHYQPHLPSDLGFYDLRVPEVREQQADLARAFGIDGFCYYHYWFNETQLLERPLAEILAAGRPDFPFCICWANENWTRRWDGYDAQVLIGQSYSADDDRKHIQALLPYLADPRYIRVDGRPLLAVYRSGHLPDPARTAEIWREESVRAGVGDLFLCRFEAWDPIVSPDPRTIGFDAAVEFAPDWRRAGGQEFSGWKAKLLCRLGLLPRVYLENRLFDYREMVKTMRSRPPPSYPLFRGVTPGFDNSARRKKGATIVRHSSASLYGEWLEDMLRWTEVHHAGQRRLVFVNAWNEWAEGNHLEPDQQRGHSYLEANIAAVTRVRPKDGASRS